MTIRSVRPSCLRFISVSFPEMVSNLLPLIIHLGRGMGKKNLPSGSCGVLLPKGGENLIYWVQISLGGSLCSMKMNVI